MFYLEANKNSAQVFKMFCVNKTKFGKIMNCKEIEHKINNLIDLKEAENLPSEIKEHLDNCDSCSRFYRVSMDLENFLRERKEAEVSDIFFNQVMNKLEAQKKSDTKVIKHSFLRSYRSVAASVLFILALGLGILVGNYSANTISNNTIALNQDSDDILGIQVADNSYDLINFNE